MLQNQLARGNNGLIKTKYLTFGINADSIKAAKPRLERIETDILNNFKRLGVAARTLDGKERLFQLHAVFHMDEQLPFQFEWDWLAPSGLSTKDFIAPSSFEFRTGKQFRMGKKYGAVSFLQILAPELNDRLLADFLDMESSLIVSMHIQSVDQVKAIKTVKGMQHPLLLLVAVFLGGLFHFLQHLPIQFVAPLNALQIGEDFHFLVLQLGICVVGQFLFNPAVKGFLISPIGFQLFTLIPELFQNQAQGIIHLGGVVISFEFQGAGPFFAVGRALDIDLEPDTGLLV